MMEYGELDLGQTPAKFKYLRTCCYQYLPALSDIVSAAQKPHSGYTFLPHFQIKVTPFLPQASQGHTHLIPLNLPTLTGRPRLCVVSSFRALSTVGCLWQASQLDFSLFPVLSRPPPLHGC